VPVLLHAEADDRPIKHVECGEQRRRAALSFVLVGSDHENREALMIVVLDILAPASGARDRVA
jgi:hypothetical protein